MLGSLAALVTAMYVLVWRWDPEAREPRPARGDRWKRA